MPPQTQLRGSQILDGSITADDVDDALEKELTKVRVTTNDSSADFLSSKVVSGTGISVTVVGASGSSQTLRIAATGGGGGGGGSSLTISGALGNTAYSDVPTTLVFDDSTGFQVADAGSGVAKVTIASHFKNIFVSGSETLIATGSDSLEVQGDGGVQVFTYIDEEGYASGSILAPKILLVTATALSQSLAARITNIVNTIVPAWYVQSGTSYGQSTFVGTSTDYARADHQHGTPPAELSNVFFDALFGDQSDGDVTISGFTTLSREMHYNNLTVTSTGRLKPNGNRIFVRGTLTIDVGGSIDDDGFDATNQVGRTGFVARNYLGGQGTNGGSGWSLNAANFANGNSAVNNTNCSLNATNTAPSGGNGGNSSSRTGGLGGTAPQNATPQKWSGRALDGRGSFGAFNGGSGGGGGAIHVGTYTNGTFVSGGGGSGAGIVWIAASTIVNSGNISARGGNGANGSLGGGTGNCGGGGGGGGGNVAIITRSTSIGGTVNITGGTGGTAVGVGATNGGNGNAGSYVMMVVK